MNELTADSLIDLFRKNEALLEGHFVLSSGLHSDRYMQSALLLQKPDLAEMLGKALSAKFSTPVDAVLSPALGGLIIGHEVARAKKCRAIFSEKDDVGKPVLRRGFQIEKGENVLIVEDVITTGLSTGEVAKLVLEAGGVIAGIGAIVNRSGKDGVQLFPWKVPVEALLSLSVHSWASSDCTLCKKGVPAVKPGSRKK